MRCLALSSALLACNACSTRPVDDVASSVEPVLAPGLRCAGLRTPRAESVTSGYQFELNGEPVHPDIRTLSGDSGTPYSGDVITIRDISMVLGPVGVYRYSSASTEPWWRVELAVDDGPKRLVGLRLMGRERAEPMPQDLRGLVVDTDDPSIRELDVSTMFVEQDLGAYGEPGGSAWRPMPPTLRYMRLHVYASPNATLDVANLSETMTELSLLRDLRYLEIQIHQDPGARLLELDVAPLTALSNLERLEVRGQLLTLPLRNLERLAALKRLRALELDFITAVDLAFVKELPELRWLRLERISAVDLRPLSAHPKLLDVHIDAERTSELPDPLPPSLRTLKLLSPQIRAEQIIALRAQAPAAEIRGDWDLKLVEEVACATKIRVRAGCHCAGCSCTGCVCSGCICDPRDDRVLFEVTDLDAIRDVARLFTTELGDARTHCMGGSATIEFYRDESRIAAVEFDAPQMHAKTSHPPRLRWSEGGRSIPRRISEANAAALCAWFTRNDAGHVCEIETRHTGD